MKLVLSFLAGLLATPLSADAQIFFTNKVNSANASKIASRLKAGMGETEMISILATNGLTNAVSVGGGGGVYRSYFLSDGYILSLDATLNPNGWTNRILRSACIESNGSKISITLTNR